MSASVNAPAVQPAAKPVRRSVPVASTFVDISLDEFNMDEIIQYVRDNGGDCDDGEGLYIDSKDLSRIDHLALCGQADEARKLALEIIGEKIGRTL